MKFISAGLDPPSMGQFCRGAAQQPTMMHFANVRKTKKVTFALPPLSGSCYSSSEAPPSSSPSSSPPEATTPTPAPRPRNRMTEPRARAARHKGQLNFHPEISSLLHAFGDTSDPLPETIRVLDEIVTDFIIETCHAAARSATASRRQKIKVEDFKWAVRGDEVMLGRVRELLGLERELRDARRQFDTGEGKVGLERGGRKRKAEEMREGL